MTSSLVKTKFSFNALFFICFFSSFICIFVIYSVRVRKVFMHKVKPMPMPTATLKSEESIKIGTNLHVMYIFFTLRKLQKHNRRPY